GHQWLRRVHRVAATAGQVNEPLGPQLPGGLNQVQVDGQVGRRQIGRAGAVGLDAGRNTASVNDVPRGMPLEKRVYAGRVTQVGRSIFALARAGNAVEASVTQAADNGRAHERVGAGHVNAIV